MPRHLSERDVLRMHPDSFLEHLQDRGKYVKFSTFDVSGQADSVDRMPSRIFNYTYKHFFEKNPETGELFPLEQRQGRYTFLRGEFGVWLDSPEESPFAWAYQKNGAKITKLLRTLLLRQLGVPKDVLESRWADYCKDVMSHYLPAFNCEATWSVPKEIVGEGLMESGSTCFAFDGENARCKDFLLGYNRARVLYLRNTADKMKRARCLVHFVGGRKIMLTNFYYVRFPQNDRLFVEAVKHSLGLKKFTFSYSSKDCLPVYTNGTTITITADRSFDSSGVPKWTCYVCGKKVPLETVKVSHGPYSYGCSYKCLEKHPNITNQRRCCECGDHFHEDDGTVNDYGDFLCSNCSDWE
jgi:hypothetical protein